MSVLSAVRRAILGETWTLPLGMTAIVLVAAFLVRPLLPGLWDHAGGFLLLAGVGAILTLSVWLSAGPRRRS